MNMDDFFLSKPQTKVKTRLGQGKHASCSNQNIQQHRFRLASLWSFYILFFSVCCFLFVVVVVVLFFLGSVGLVCVFLPWPPWQRQVWQFITRTGITQVLWSPSLMEIIQHLPSSRRPSSRPTLHSRVSTCPSVCNFCLLLFFSFFISSRLAGQLVQHRFVCNVSATTHSINDT